MSWSEPGARHPPKGDHMWHRLSVHVKRQEASSNQMAVIKPLTNTYHNRHEFSDLSTKTLYNVAEEEEIESVRYNLPATPPMMAHGQIPACVQLKDVDEEVELFNPGHLQPDDQQMIMKHLQGKMVINFNFNNDIPEHNDMISITETVSMPIHHQAHFNSPEDPVLPKHPDSFDEEPSSPLEGDNIEQFGLLQSYLNNKTHIHDEEAEAKLAMEDPLALMPPSPFRDCACPPVSPFPNSPVSESILCSPSNVIYASVILGDFKQSSSTL